MRALILLLMVAQAVTACREPAPSAPGPGTLSAPASAAPATTPEPIPDAAPVAAPAGDRWARVAPAEPDPQAKALYRAAMGRLARGDYAGATPLIQQIRREHPDSRFAARLDAAGGRAGGPIALLAAVAGLLAGAAK